MKKLKLLATTFLLIGLTSSTCTQTKTIDNCYINFEGVKNLTAKTPDKLPESAAKPREVKTEDGIKSVSRNAGYRVLYLNNKNGVFVNLKIEQSSNGFYDIDKKILLENLRYLIKNSSGMKSKDVIELEFNGQKIYGLSPNSIEKGSSIGTFIMFPGNDIVVYFYINNLSPEYRNFKSLKDYEKQRNKFMNEYTKHINNCT
jgi:hypothetical protein